jgi:4-hydroxy-L-threonine phosphate dehydrogenase PdxA
MTEYLAKINKRNTIMLMHGEKFSVIPLTTHINLKDVKSS